MHDDYPLDMNLTISDDIVEVLAEKFCATCTARKKNDFGEIECPAWWSMADPMCAHADKYEEILEKVAEWVKGM